jgi:uncharacterized membrane protein YdjX (TVP38/TMEM64 family)
MMMMINQFAASKSRINSSTVPPKKRTPRKSSAKKRTSKRKPFKFAITRSHLITAGLVVLAGLVIWFLREPVLSYLTFVADKPAFSAYIKGFGVWGPLVLILLQVLQVLIAMLPGYAFFIGAGYIYGIPVGYPLNLFSTVLASQIAFGIARYFGRPVVYRLAPKDIIQRWDSRARKFGFMFFLTSFWLPIFPSDTMNYLAGLTAIPGRQFLLASLLGRAPAILVLTTMGAYGVELTTMGLPWTTWVLIAAGCITLYWGWQYIFNRIKPDSLKF